MVEALFQIAEPGASQAKAACKIRAAGIDLGTTHSLIAVVAAGEPVCIDVDGDAGDAGADVIVPSVVHYAAGGQVVVGRSARDEHAVERPADTIVSVKRFMGRGAQEIVAGAAEALLPYRFAPARDGVVRFAVSGDRAVTPIEVSAEILKVLRARAELALGGPLEGVVITVPAYFDDGQRQATRDAGRLAGLEVMRLLNEPTAAALAYGLDKKRDGTFAVFDLGGGTFDISILKLSDGVFEVKATGGDSALGGDDFDRAIAEVIFARMEAAGGAIDRGAAARAVLAAARAGKERLTTADSTPIEVTLPGRAVFTTVFSRAELETAVTPVLERCAAPVRRALADAGVAAADLDDVLLVGGATRMPVVRAAVARWFGRAPLADLDPDRVVALGAAIQAELLAGGDNPGDVVLLDVVPLSLGLEMMGGVVERLIHRNSTVPCGAQQVFTTYADNQTGWDLHVVQGERELASQCRSLARFKLTGIPPGPAGLARLEVTFSVDTDGLLHVAARELGTGQEASVECKPSYGLGEGEVERMLLESFEHAARDVRERSLAEQRIEADRILNATRAALGATPEMLLAGERETIERSMAALQIVQAGDDAAAMREGIKALDLSSKDFAARRMNAALERGFAGRKLDRVEKDMAAHDTQHKGSAR